MTIGTDGGANAGLHLRKTDLRWKSGNAASVRESSSRGPISLYGEWSSERDQPCKEGGIVRERENERYSSDEQEHHFLFRRHVTFVSKEDDNCSRNRGGVSLYTHSLRRVRYDILMNRIFSIYVSILYTAYTNRLPTKE